MGQNVAPQTNVPSSPQIPDVWLHRLLGQHVTPPQQLFASLQQVPLQQNSPSGQSSLDSQEVCAMVCWATVTTAAPPNRPPIIPLITDRREVPSAKARVRASNFLLSIPSSSASSNACCIDRQMIPARHLLGMRESPPLSYAPETSK
jgi:hypothetical protein